MTLSWQFEEKNSDTGPGWNASIIRTFKQNRLKSLACEVLQNSTDNPSKGSTEPVHVTFSQVSIDREKIPGVSELTSRLEAIFDCAKETESDKQKIIKENITLSIRKLYRY